MSRRKSKAVSRRDFLKTASVIAGSMAAGAIGGCVLHPHAVLHGNTVELIREPSDAVAHSPVVEWAIAYLRTALKAKGIALAEGNAPSHGVMLTIRAASTAAPATPEQVSLVPTTIDNNPAILAKGSDERGLAYALTELADRVDHSAEPRTALVLDKPILESPANKTRSICRVFVSEEEDKPWFYDKDGWLRYFDMLAVNRFNKFNLSLGLAYDFSTRVADAYFFFPYPFFALKVPNYNVRAIARDGKPLSLDEQVKNLSTLQFISKEASKRGIHFQLGLWTHSIKWPTTANYTLDGITPETQAPYSRAALRSLLEMCPDVKGVTIRTHGESGVPEGDISLWKTVFDGTKLSWRKVQIDLHAKGITQEIIDAALATGNPVIVTPKFWAEHNGLPYFQASIREWELPKANDTGGLMSRSTGTRNHTRYGFADLLQHDRKYGIVHRVFPGTQRFLLWGDPLFAREYGKIFSFDNTDGVEFFEPLAFKGRQGTGLAKNRGCYAEAALAPQWSDQIDKYAYTFRLWGRMTYNPNSDPDVYRRLLRHDYGTAAKPIEDALGNASRILPLVTVAHSPSAAQANFWPEVYSNMSHHDATNPTYGDDTPSPKVFGTVSSLDPQLFANVNEYADTLLAGQGIGKMTPQEVAEQLDIWADNALKSLNGAKGDGIAFRRAAIDIGLLATMGKFWAAKFRTGIFYAIFDKSGHEPARQQALTAYQAARDAMADAAARAKGVYIDDITFGEDHKIRGTWAARVAHIDTDIAGMKTAAPRARTATPEQAATALAVASRHSARPQLTATFIAALPAGSHKGNMVIPVTLPTPRQQPPVAGMRILYRHVNQAEKYLSTDMSHTGDTYIGGAPPGSNYYYTSSPYDLAYYVEVSFANGEKAICPGFKKDFVGIPYVLIPLT